MQTATLSPAAARQGITQNGLKLLALSLMLLDHIYYFFGFTGAIPLVFTWLGRLSAPLFLFSLVEGWAHTRSKTRYFLRIWLLGAGMGAVQYACILMPGLQRADGFFPAMRRATFRDRPSLARRRHCRLTGTSVREPAIHAGSCRSGH